MSRRQIAAKDVRAGDIVVSDGTSVCVPKGEQIVFTARFDGLAIKCRGVNGALDVAAFNHSILPDGNNAGMTFFREDD